MVAKFDKLIEPKNLGWKILDILPEVLNAGEDAGVLTEEGAKKLDPSGTLQAGTPLCPPEGDAGTGMVATNAVRQRTGNVSAGTSSFSMIVLEKALSRPYEVIDMFYTYQDIAVKDREERQNYDCILKRGVTVLQLNSQQEIRPDYIKSFQCTVTGNCGNVFNPTTGHCLQPATLTKTYDISGDRFKAKRFLFTIYFFLGGDDVTDITLNTQTTDTEDKVVKKLSFENVHMVKGKMTIYKGPFLSTHSAVSFTIDSPTIPDSGFSTEFE